MTDKHHTTSPKDVENELRQSAERFRTIFEYAPVMIDSFDSKGECLLWNRECVKNLGWTFEEISACDDPIAMFYPDASTRDEVLGHISAADGIFREFKPRAKDGSVRIQIWADFVFPDATRMSVGHDVTELRRAGGALTETEEKYRSIFNLATNGIVLLDSDTGMIVDCNPEFERQTGRPLDDLRKLPVWELRPPGEVESAKRMCKGIVDNGVGGSDKLHFQRPDGELVPIDFLGKLVSIGDKTYVQSVTRDITERRLAEEALKTSEEKYRQIFSEARDGIVLADDRGYVLDCNPEFEKQTGRPLEVLKKMRVWDLRPPQDVGQAKELFRELGDKKTIDVREQKFEKPNGDITIVEMRGREVTIGGERFKQVTTRDITERKRTERELHAADERLRLAVGQVPAVLWTTDRELRFTSSMGAGLKALGLETSQVLGMDLFEYFQTDDVDFLPIAMHRRVLEGASVNYQMEFEGHVFQTLTEPLRDEKGEIIGCLGMSLDVTARVKAEKKVKESEQKLRALASRLQSVREEESANIAREIHDELGQNLTGLKMDISWINRRIVEMGSNDACVQVADRLKSMASAVDETIQTVRRISTQLRPVILDDMGLLRALEWQAGEFETRTGIACDFQSETENALDPDRSTAVFRIFQEILTNVVRHAGASRVAVKLTNDNGFFVLDVIDDGRGISDDEITSSRALGILGMQERAQVCGGNVLIQRSNDKGTRVTVKVPVE